MRIGVTGHQTREGIDWAWVRAITLNELKQIESPSCALTSLAVGSDQVFAEVALALGIPVLAVLPFADYEACFSGESLERYRELLSRCNVKTLVGGDTTEAGFFLAGQFIVEKSDVLLAIWDGEPAAGLGGTADVVHHARIKHKSVIHVDPIRQKVKRFLNSPGGE